MSVRYNKLWKILVDKKLNKTQFRDTVDISNQTLSKLSKNQFVSLEVLDRICDVLKCNIGDIVEHISEKGVETKKAELRVVSLFSGIGGFESGIDSSNISAKVVFASEIEKFATLSYQSNYPDHMLVGDITKIHETDIPDHDILVGGFPCQAFSIAGKRNGFKDTRGTLFFEVAKILKEKTPRIVLLENVENLINHDKSNTIRTILLTLSELGYTVDFTILNSSEMGVPQNRSRTFILGIKNFPSEPYKEDFRSQKISSLKKELNLDDNFNGFNFFNDLKSNNEDKYIKDILENSVDSKYYFDSKKVQNYIDSLEIPKINSEKKIIKVFDFPKEVHNDQERQRRVHSIEGISPTILARSDTTKILVEVDGKLKVRKLTPIENMRIQGFDEAFIDNIKNIGMSDTQMYKQSGNAVSPPVISEIFNLINDSILHKKRR
ncbi:MULTISPECIES: DNA (cytosine-5-)-methyltransferase [unclassified Gemella]|uniref:DNA (cytosine-5-)-methyltransferase n=1 Tax=unclassified Gemella TaxID=2624949 RepID=UPI001C054FD6|nr:MULTISPECIES: DNA (cytosine-5-)-methyltransferase [unclassified Gemella]MBU0278744.1 DNA (cytosine-5-)-methyltransferase [Gemella sp. zg-1178]QWQ38685.1 DNA (cytosine-5-)-methyltransferase [Gemella sp. zg-570]